MTLKLTETSTRCCWRQKKTKKKKHISLLCSRLNSLNWTVKTLPETQEVCLTPQRKTNKMSFGLTAFGSRVSRTRYTYMLGPRDNKRCLTSRTLSHNSDGLKRNRSWQGHESGWGRLVFGPPGRRRLLSASPNLQSLHGNTHLLSKQSLLLWVVPVEPLDWLTKWGCGQTPEPQSSGHRVFIHKKVLLTLVC